MAVLNIHSRDLPVSCDAAGALIDALASGDDRMWPSGQWPAIRLKPALDVGAAGGHGPIRYVVVDYQPGRWARFRFTRPRGFDGFHEFTAEPVGATHVRLTHLTAMRPRGLARLSWPLFYHPLHDALLEDALDNAAHALTGQAHRSRWRLRVRALRRLGRILMPKA